MGRLPIKKSLQKKKTTVKVEPVAKKSVSVIATCTRCGIGYGKREGYFPKSNSSLFRGIGYLPICSDCCDSMFDYYFKKLGSDREAMRRMCMKLDLYWDNILFDSVAAKEQTRSIVRSYIRRVSTPAYVNKTFDDTLHEEAYDFKNTIEGYNSVKATQKAVQDAETARLSEIEVEQNVIDFWGAGYSPDMYLELERRYGEWTGGNAVVEPNVRSLYKQICLLETIIARDSADGKAIDKNVNALNTLLGSMNLKPAQKKEDVDGELERMPLGVGIQKWEFERPLPPTPDNQKDVNKLIKNIHTWFTGHICKMVGIKNSYCKMYEDAIDKLRVERPEFADEDDDTLLTNVFGDQQNISGDCNASE